MSGASLHHRPSPATSRMNGPAALQDGDDWDIVVVGAGPAGAMTACLCARLGVARVLLIERAVFPRAKVCGSCLSRAALHELDVVGLGWLVRGQRGVPLDRLVIATSRRRATLPLPSGAALSRRVLDAALVDEAIHAGVRFIDGVIARVGSLEADGAARPVAVRSRRGIESVVRARCVVIASGLGGCGMGHDGVEPGGLAHHCRVAADARIGAGAVLGAAPPWCAPGEIVMAYGAGGYVGLTRLEDDRLDVAAAFDPLFVRFHGGLAQAAGALLDGARVERPRDLLDAAWRGTARLTQRPTSVAGARLFRVGDAAGYIEPFTGEGIAWALISARLAAPLAAAVATEATPPAHAARAWRELHARVIVRRQRGCRAVSRLLRHPAAVDLAVTAMAHWPAPFQAISHRLHRPWRGIDRTNQVPARLRMAEGLAA